MGVLDERRRPRGVRTALAEDPTVDRVRVVTDTPTRRLYSATLVGDPDDPAHGAFNEHGVRVLEATDDHRRTEMRVRCHSRDAFAALRNAVESRYGRFVTRRLYREEDEDDGCVVTPAQREAFVRALDRGYFEVPRSTTLGAIADELDVSDRAVSSRLRRGGRGARPRDARSRQPGLKR